MAAGHAGRWATYSKTGGLAITLPSTRSIGHRLDVGGALPQVDHGAVGVSTSTMWRRRSAGTAV